MKRTTIALGVLVTYLIFCLYCPSIFNKPIDSDCDVWRKAVAGYAVFGIPTFLCFLFETVRTYVNLRDGDEYRGNSKVLRWCLA